MDWKHVIGLKSVGALALLSAATGCYADAGYGYGYGYGYGTPGYTTTYGVAATPTYGYGYNYAGDGTYGYGYSDYPSAAYVATTTPYYYDGRPTYWYNNRWNYMEGGRWNHYQSEPAELGRYRAQGFGRGVAQPYQNQNTYRGGGGYQGGGRAAPSQHFFERPAISHYHR